MKTKTRVPESRKSARSTTRTASKTKVVRKGRTRKAETPHDWISRVSGVLDSPRNGNIEGKTPYERTKHLLEVLTDLPSDLLTNPKYFEDFGR